MADIIATQLEAKTIGGSSTAVDDPNLCVTKLKAINSFNCNVINADTYSNNQLVCKKDLISNNVIIEYYDTLGNKLFIQTVSPAEFKLPTTKEILQLLKNNNITSVCNTELYNWANGNTEKALSFFIFVQYKDKSIYDSNGSNVYYTSGDIPSSIQTGTQKYIVTIQPYIEIFVGNSDQFINLTWSWFMSYIDPTLNEGYITCRIEASGTNQACAYSTITVKMNTVIIKGNNGTQSIWLSRFFSIYANTFMNGASYTPDETFYLALGQLNQTPETVNYKNCAASEFDPLGTSSPGCSTRYNEIREPQASVTWKICGADDDYTPRVLEFQVTLYK